MSMMAWAHVFLLFLVKAPPRWLLRGLAALSAFATVKIGSAFANLPVNELLALPRGMWDGNPKAWACFVLLGCVFVVFRIYRRLWIGCEVGLALIARQRRNNR